MRRTTARHRWLLAIALALALVLAPTAQAFGAMYSLGKYPARDVPVVVTRGITVDGKKLVALTFDDGPGVSTSAVLDVLRDRGVRATFFTTGWVETYPAQAQRIVAEGHQIANHTLTHRTLTTADTATIRYQVLAGQAAIQGVTGVLTTVLRAPGGSYDARVYNAVPEAISIHVGWDVDPQDWMSPGTSAIVSRCISGGQYGGIILLHDGGGGANRSQTVAALPAIIDGLRARGCEFVTIDELCRAITGGVPFELAPNAVYRFYNRTSSSHFYTFSADEATTVLARWPFEFRYEGIAYAANLASNTQPLFRFYNVRARTHFYTASAEERDVVAATWPGIFTYEGVAYAVSPPGTPGAAPVYRFYNLRTGCHFYTASAEERDAVMAKWPDIFLYEGEAFSVLP